MKNSMVMLGVQDARSFVTRLMLPNPSFLELPETSLRGQRTAAASLTRDLQS